MVILYKNTPISFSISGNGPAVVWLHGFMENKEIWRNQIPLFDSFSTNICIDLLGHGQTKSLTETHTMENQAAVVMAVLNSLSITTFSIVGHSMGGYVALSLLEIYQNKIKHFVLLNSTSCADSVEKKKHRDRAINLVSSNKTNFLRMGIINLFSENSRKQFSKEILELIGSLQNNTEKGIVSALLGMKIRKNQNRTLQDFSGKKMIISGKEDPILKHASIQAEATKTQTQLTTLEGGHMSYLEAKTTLNEALVTFLLEK